MNMQPYTPTLPVNPPTIDPESTVRLIGCVTRTALRLFEKSAPEGTLAGVAKIRAHFDTRFDAVLTAAVIEQTGRAATGRGLLPLEAQALFFEPLREMALTLIAERVMKLVYADVIALYMAETRSDPFTGESFAAAE